jgi:hypothetical protein
MMSAVGSLFGGAAPAATGAAGGGNLLSQIGTSGQGGDLLGSLMQDAGVPGAGMPAGGGVMANGEAPNPWDETLGSGMNAEWMKNNPGTGGAEFSTPQALPAPPGMGGLMGMAMQQAPQVQAPGQRYNNPYINSLMGG